MWQSGMIGDGVDLPRQERSYASLELGEIAIAWGVLVLVSSSLRRLAQAVAPVVL